MSSSPTAPGNGSSRYSLNRRGLIRLAGAGAASAVATPWSSRAAAAAAEATPAPEASDAAWSDLAGGLQGWLLRPGDAMYPAAAEINATRYAGTVPAGIAVCVAPEDVAVCVSWAQQTGVPFAVRSGGHSYAGFSTSSGLVIDVRGMRSVRVDPDNGTVTVAAGANNGNIGDALKPHGVYFPGGRCPTVGVAGLTLGGGWGFSCRHLGLTCDTLLATDLVTADGNLVTASGSENQDLFWAVRGAGHGNFGVHTSFTLAVVPARDVTVFRSIWSGGELAALIDGLLHMQLDGPRELGFRIAVRSSSLMPRSQPEPLEIRLLGMYWGAEQDVEEMLAKVERIQAAEFRTIQTMPFSEAREYLVATTPIGTYQVKSGFLRGTVPADGINTMLDGVADMPGVPSRSQESTASFFCWGGKVNDVAPDATAFVHRQADFLFKSEAIWSPDDPPELIAANLEWLDGFHAAMEPYLTGGAYQNFPDRTLTDWARAYYGENLERLVGIKRARDPDNLFRYPQSIPLD